MKRISGLTILGNRNHSERKNKNTHCIQDVPFRSVCLCGKAMIRRGEIYHLPIWKLILDVYSCHGCTDVIVVTLLESDLRTSVIFKQHSELKGSNCTLTVLAAPPVRLLHIVTKFTVWKTLLRWYKHTHRCTCSTLCYFILIIVRLRSPSCLLLQWNVPTH